MKSKLILWMIVLLPFYMNFITGFLIGKIRSLQFPNNECFSSAPYWSLRIFGEPLSALFGRMLYVPVLLMAIAIFMLGLLSAYWVRKKIGSQKFFKNYAENDGMIFQKGGMTLAFGLMLSLIYLHPDRQNLQFIIEHYRKGSDPFLLEEPTTQTEEKNRPIFKRCRPPGFSGILLRIQFDQHLKTLPKRGEDYTSLGDLWDIWNSRFPFLKLQGYLLDTPEITRMWLEKIILGYGVKARLYGEKCETLPSLGLSVGTGNTCGSLKKSDDLEAHLKRIGSPLFTKTVSFKGIDKESTGKGEGIVWEKTHDHCLHLKETSNGSDQEHYIEGHIPASEGAYSLFVANLKDIKRNGFLCLSDGVENLYIFLDASSNTDHIGADQRMGILWRQTHYSHGEVVMKVLIKKDPQKPLTIRWENVAIDDRTIYAGETEKTSTLCSITYTDFPVKNEQSK